jgi:glycosyltransferase involved in cell wall biosynthesis
MKKIKLAVIFDQLLFSGGGYQQSINAALIAKKLSSNHIEVIFFTTHEENIKILKELGIFSTLIKFSFLSKLRVFLYRKIKNEYLYKLLRFFEKNNPREKIFIENKIDLIFFLSPTSWPIDCEKINYITTVWDLCHLDELEFPEVRYNREFERRERNYKSILPKAVAILVDSVSTKNNLIKKYCIDADRVYIFPFEPANFVNLQSNSIRNLNINIKKKYNLNSDYIFYPAQFWSHKNHIYLIEGLKYLEEKFGLIIGAILVGKDKGNLNFIRNKVEALKLSDRVRFPGFVSNDEMPELYRQSLALVMPTYFGPTNIPPLEAFYFGTPVLYPDKIGLRDQVGSGALLIDLKDCSTMASHLKNLLEDKNFRMKIIEEGKKMHVKNKNTVNREKIIQNIIDNFRYKIKCWK